MASKQIPDRWLNYKAIGQRVEGTRFIAFKVPLKQHIIEDVEKDDRLDGQMLLDTVPNLGVIIDLTNTNRYYDPSFFQAKGVDHIKIMIPGHVTPPQRLVKRFKDFVKKFIQNNPDNDKLIGVHCTHGVNRTGFLICNYMVSEMAVAANEAIDKFAAARGHRIERKNYLDALHQLTAAEGNSSSIRSTERGHTTQYDHQHHRAQISGKRVSRVISTKAKNRFEDRMRSKSPLNRNTRDRVDWRKPVNVHHNEREPNPPRRQSPPNQIARDRYNRRSPESSNPNEIEPSSPLNRNTRDRVDWRKPVNVHHNEREPNPPRRQSPPNQIARYRNNWRSPESSNHNEIEPSRPIRRSPPNHITRDRFSWSRPVNSNHHEIEPCPPSRTHRPQADNRPNKPDCSQKPVPRRRGFVVMEFRGTSAYTNSNTGLGHQHRSHPYDNSHGPPNREGFQGPHCPRHYQHDDRRQHSRDNNSSHRVRRDFGDPKRPST